jgi:hypothetical protein
MERTKRPTNQMIVETLINRMFEIAGHTTTYNDIVDRKDAWYSEWTMTEEQNSEWKKWGVDYLRKTKRWNKILSEREMVWFDLMYGLKIDPPIAM